MFKHLEEIQENEDYIEDWFQKVTRAQHSSILQRILTFNPNGLIFHILVDIQVYFSNLNVSILETLIRKWLHWKYSYT